MTFRMFPACPIPDGYQPYKVKVSFPSGKMVVANDLRGVFPRIPHYWDEEIPREDKLKWNINSHRGCQTVTEFCAQNGWLHFSVGNTSPSVYKRKGEIIVSVPAYNEQGTDEDDEYIHVEGRKVADVCTDLWWISIADYDQVMHNLANGIGEEERRPKKPKELLKDPKALAEEMDWTIVAVAKGEYEFTIQPCLPIVDSEKPHTYAEAKLVKKQGRT